MWTAGKLLYFLTIKKGSLIKMFRKKRHMAILLSGTPVFPSPQKPTIPNSNSTTNQVDEEPL